MTYGFIVLLKLTEYGVYGDLSIIYPKPYSIYLMGDYRVWGSNPWFLLTSWITALSGFQDPTAGGQTGMKKSSLLSYMWQLPKIRGTFWGVPIRIRIVMFWGPYWGPPIWGNYHVSSHHQVWRSTAPHSENYQACDKYLGWRSDPGSPAKPLYTEGPSSQSHTYYSLTS